MSAITLDLPAEADTLALGARLAGLLVVGDVIALHGGLGMGKTTLVRGLIGALLGPGTETPSPTYNLVQTYTAPAFELWHFDLYRLDTPEELHELGWHETQDGVALIEWPDRAGALLPTWRLDLTLSDTSTGGRKALLEPRGEHWQGRLDDGRF